MVLFFMTERPSFAQMPQGDGTGQEHEQRPSTQALLDALSQSPHLRGVVELIRGYQAFNSEKRRRLLDHKAREMINSPMKITQAIDTMGILGDAGDTLGAKNMIVDFVHALERAVKDMQPFPPDPGVLEQWLVLFSDQSNYNVIGRVLLRKMIQRCGDPKSTINFLYELALAGFTSSDAIVFREINNILSYQSTLLTSDDPQARYALEAIFHRDEQCVRKTRELLLAQGVFMNNQQQAFYRAVDAVVGEQPMYRKALQTAFESDEEGVKALLQTPSDIFEMLDGRKPIDLKLIKTYPWSLLFEKPGPLKLWCDEVLAMRENERTGGKKVAIHLPTGHFVDEPKREFIQKALETDPSANQQPLESGMYWNTLSYLSPESLFVEQRRRELRLRNDTLIEQLRNDPTCLLNPDGDRVEFSDSLLTELGYKEVLFAIGEENPQDTVVTLTAGNYQYRVLLDARFALREVKTRKSIVLPSRGVFIENVLLEHLHAIMCSGKRKEKEHTRNGGEGGGGEQRRSRRAHRRLLPLGDNPTPQQIVFALQCGRDVVRWNREREEEAKKSASARGEQFEPGKFRKYTFVSGYKSKTPGPPVVSDAPQAAVELHKILGV